MTTLERLEAEPVLDTVRRLEERIAARFPERGLRRVAGELVELTADVGRDAAGIQGRIRMVRMLSRVGVAIVLAATVTAVVLAARTAVDEGAGEGLDWLFLLESSINDLAYAAIALYFLYTVPERVQRGHTLELLHRLRSLAHIIDMHQLTKDPERLNPAFQQTAASPDPGLDRAADGALPRLLLGAAEPGQQDRRALRRGVAGQRRPGDGEPDRAAHQRDVAQDLAEDLRPAVGVIAPQYTMSPMDFPGRRRLTAVVALGLLLPVAACSDEAGIVGHRAGRPDLGSGRRPRAGRAHRRGDPGGSALGELRRPGHPPGEGPATDLTARSAPEGGSFVPVVWSFADDRIFGEMTRLFGDRQPLEVELVTGGEHYSLTPPDSGPAARRSTSRSRAAARTSRSR